MARALALAALLLATSCGGTSRPACGTESLNALRALYKGAARDVIMSGACDSHEAVQDCPEYRAIEMHFALAMEVCDAAR